MNETFPTPEGPESSNSDAEHDKSEQEQVIAAIDRAFDRSTYGLTLSETVKVPAKILYGRTALGNLFKRSPKIHQQTSVLVLRGAVDSGEVMHIRRIEDQDTGRKSYDLIADADRDPQGLLASVNPDGDIRSYRVHPQIDNLSMAAWIDSAYDAPFSAEDREGQYRNYVPLES